MIDVFGSFPVRELSPKNAVKTRIKVRAIFEDLPEAPIPVEATAPVVKPVTPVILKSISAQEYSDHMQLSINQLETVALMLQVLEQADGGPAPTE